MKRIFSSVSLALLSFPIAGLACAGGDCSGMELPPPTVPTPGSMENLLGALSDHAGLFAGLFLAVAMGIALFRQRKLLATQSSTPSFAGGTS